MKTLPAVVLSMLICLPTISWPKEVKDMNTMEIIHSRKSVRSFTGAAVSKADLETLVRAGMDKAGAAIIVCAIPRKAFEEKSNTPLLTPRQPAKTSCWPWKRWVWGPSTGHALPVKPSKKVTRAGIVAPLEM
jgi:hypothetical protein